MSRDFTFEIYEELLQAGLDAGYEHITVREYLSAEELPDRFIIHRHDIDRKPENALTMAQIESRKGIPSTYYFRTIDKTFQPGLIQEIEALGHEIGYHYEDMDRADGNVSDVHRSFSAELARIRALVTVETICMHGNPLTSYDNRDMWTGDHSPSEYGLLGEAYLSMDFEDVTYFSDTGRTWMDGPLKIKDHTMGEGDKTVQVDSTQELIELVASGQINRMCLLSHPNRWAATLPEYFVEKLKDTITNMAKWIIQTAASIKS